MTQHPPCYRHPRHVWMAGCADCTAWHQAALAARHDDPSGAPSPRTRPAPHGSRSRARAAA